MKRQLSKTIYRATDTFKELILIYLSVISITAFAFSLAEHKDFLTSLWWAFVTAMTIGYGDVYPVTVAGKMIGVVLMHIVPLIVIPLITARLAAKMVVDSDVFTHTEQEEIKHSLRAIKEKLHIEQ